MTTSGSGPPDSVLIREARTGQEWAKEALYRRYAPMVNGLAYRLLGGDADLDDLVQESFVQALTCLDSLRSTDTFRSWLSSIVVRTAHKLLRRRGLLRRLGLYRRQEIEWEAVRSSGVAPDDWLELRTLYSLVDELPAKWRVPLLLKHVEGRTLEQIAELTGASLATVKRRIDKAQAQLEQARASEALESGAGLNGKRGDGLGSDRESSAGVSSRATAKRALGGGTNSRG